MTGLSESLRPLSARTVGDAEASILYCAKRALVQGMRAERTRPIDKGEAVRQRFRFRELCILSQMLWTARF